MQKVIFADLNGEAVSALSAELARQAPQHVLSLHGTRAGCEAAAQYLGRTLEVMGTDMTKSVVLSIVYVIALQMSTYLSSMFALRWDVNVEHFLKLFIQHDTPL